jgi:thiamine biosynthesis protein ThiS
MITVNQETVDHSEGMTVSDALKAMGYDFVLITVFVNGEHVPSDDHDTFVVPDGADVRALHLHHGG